MVNKILLAFATNYGSTKEVAEAISATLHESGVGVDLSLARDVRTLTGYSGIVLGAPLVMNRLHKDALTFLSRYKKLIMQLPVALFALGPVSEPHNPKEWQDAHDQLEKELSKIAWLKPIHTEIFGGKFDPALLRFPLNKLAGMAPASDIRDWEKIRTWAGTLTTLFA
jgi:menaquinone-dependent protoporphyrinogen oxidase